MSRIEVPDGEKRRLWLAFRFQPSEVTNKVVCSRLRVSGPTAKRILDHFRTIEGETNDPEVIARAIDVRVARNEICGR